MSHGALLLPLRQPRSVIAAQDRAVILLLLEDLLLDLVHGQQESLSGTAAQEVRLRGLAEGDAGWGIRAEDDHVGEILVCFGERGGTGGAGFAVDTTRGEYRLDGEDDEARRGEKEVARVVLESMSRLM